MFAVGAASRITSEQSTKQILPGFMDRGVDLWRGRRAQQQPGFCQKPDATAVRLETEVADADETARQHVEQESLDEARRVEAEQLLRVPVAESR